MRRRCPNCDDVVLLAVPEQGNGRCSRCHGTGTVYELETAITDYRLDCPACKHTGQCQTCGGTGVVLVPDRVRPHASSESNPFDDDRIAIRVYCPKCGDLDWFEWKFLGKLKDPVCGHRWYAGPGMYIFQQICAAFGAGGKYAKYLTSSVRGEGSVLGKIVGWFMGVTVGFVIRLALAAFLIPIQSLVGLFHSNNSRAEAIVRVIVIIVFTAGLIIFDRESRVSSGTAAILPLQTITTSAPALGGVNAARHLDKPEVFTKPSFDCSKARTAVELLICQQSDLATTEAEMASAYRRSLNRLPPDRRRVLQQQHLAWFKNYSRTCNQAGNNVDRHNCITSFLSARTAELNNWR